MSGEINTQFIRYLLIIAGTFFVILGMIGIFVPLLPTTPFLLAAAACFLRSSSKMYAWLFSNRFFGVYLQQYHDGKGLPRAVKIASLSMLWITLSISAVMVSLQDKLWISGLLFVIGIGVTIHIISIKSREK